MLPVKEVQNVASVVGGGKHSNALGRRHLLAVLHMVNVIRPNPLTTDDECTRHATLVACYQLAQSVLKTGFVLAKKWDRGRWVGIVMTCRAHGGCLAGYRKALVSIGWAISLLLNTNGHRKAPLPL